MKKRAKNAGAFSVQLSYPDKALSPNASKRHWRYKLPAKQTARNFKTSYLILALVVLIILACFFVPGFASAMIKMVTNCFGPYTCVRIVQ